ncbi:hypothetical protein BIW11_12386 [Tropilaelaps mercedesae]|uniref:Uncharacterized protein n=1 Tax=Tropilaelaps mercedesae TaxID=418985 RepID=A0A1V9X755_9ACAR|nr:hypothetical protein BIW11_12386 [Tropilaelaps mercedesae]
MAFSVFVLIVTAASVSLSSAKRFPVWGAYGRGGISAGARPDLHWGDNQVFHGDFSVDESQLGGKVIVFKVPSPLGKVSKQDLPRRMKIFIKDLSDQEPPTYHHNSGRYHW